MSLEIANLNKHFADKQLGQKHVLKDVTFNAENGRIVGLIGKNGSGKTTTFHCILKFIKYDGLIRLDGKEINENTYNRIGYLPEERSLMPKLTVYEQVRFLASFLSGWIGLTSSENQMTKLKAYQKEISKRCS